MLVLSRLRDETIMIGDEIEITVVDIRGDKVRLGITAPPRIAVHRKEVYEAIKRENEQASAITGGDLSALTPSRLARKADAIEPGPGRNRVRGRVGSLSAGPAPTTNGTTNGTTQAATTKAASIKTQSAEDRRSAEPSSADAPGGRRTA